MSDPFNLKRFVEAQDSVYARVLEELRRGQKSGHWMWFVFPQLRGLGHSPMADEYGISSNAEAVAYLEHPILGPRLLECTEIVNQLLGRHIEEIFGFPDYLKFRSSMTLFDHAASKTDIFKAALEKYFDGQHDPLTTDLL